MPESIRTLDMRGFTCVVSRSDPAHEVSQAAGIAVGADDTGMERRIAIALRHADGTTVCAYLDEHSVDRLAHRLADLVGTMGLPLATLATLQ